MVRLKQLKIIFSFLSVLFAFTFPIACKKKSSPALINNVPFLILGHRGMGEAYKFPGNTFEAITPVIGIGADGSEIDIQMTKDSNLILFHNVTLDAHTTCEGAVYDHSWAELGGCKYHCLEYNIYLITADYLFSRIPNLTDKYFSFDCKLNNSTAYDKEYQGVYIRAVKRLCEKFSMTENIFIEGNRDFLKTAQEIGLKNKLFIRVESTIDEAIENGKLITAYGVGFDNATASEDDVAKAHNAGLRVMMWGASTHEQNNEIMAKGADIIQTDKPIPLLKSLYRYNYEYSIP